MFRRFLAWLISTAPPRHGRTIAVYLPTRRAVLIIAGDQSLEIPEHEVLDLADGLRAAFATRDHATALAASGLQ